ncbi:uncharacterized protein LOC133350102 [Lethenteron reissneri]|uniref:uncharacterized protein LOC133350102 n=1 Tax=Lethenteron reissneri TaxID=7753 RepID=UPI002AB7A932|nr:uncharacterized protein LOC133350102 [Lethenteron reissneri]
MAMDAQECSRAVHRHISRLQIAPRPCAWLCGDCNAISADGCTACGSCGARIHSPGPSVSEASTTLSSSAAKGAHLLMLLETSMQSEGSARSERGANTDNVSVSGAQQNASITEDDFFDSSDVASDLYITWQCLITSLRRNKKFMIINKSLREQLKATAHAEGPRGGEESTTQLDDRRRAEISELRLLEMQYQLCLREYNRALCPASDALREQRNSADREFARIAAMALDQLHCNYQKIQRFLENGGHLDATEPLSFTLHSPRYLIKPYCPWKVLFGTDHYSDSFSETQPKGEVVEILDSNYADKAAPGVLQLGIQQPGAMPQCGAISRASIVLEQPIQLVFETKTQEPVFGQNCSAVHSSPGDGELASPSSHRHLGFPATAPTSTQSSYFTLARPKSYMASPWETITQSETQPEDARAVAVTAAAAIAAVDSKPNSAEWATAATCSGGQPDKSGDPGNNSGGILKQRLGVQQEHVEVDIADTNTGESGGLVPAPGAAVLPPDPTASPAATGAGVSDGVRRLLLLLHQQHPYHTSAQIIEVLKKAQVAYGSHFSSQSIRAIVEFVSFALSSQRP